MVLIVLILIIWIVNIQSEVSKIQDKLETLRIKVNHIQKNTDYKNVTVSKIPVQEEQKISSDNEIDIDEELFGEETEEIIEQKIEKEENTREKIYSKDYEYIDINDKKSVYNKIEHKQKDYHSTYNTKKQINDGNFEKVVLGRVFTVVGSIAIILGCSFFILVISNFLTPLIKAMIGLIVGSGIVIGGVTIKNEKLKKYSETLIGTGFGILFITIFCSTVISHTFSYATCLALGILILIAEFIIADKQKTVSMIAMALISGYLNVFIVHSEISPTTLFIYFIFLNVLSMLFVYRNRDKYSINYFNLIVTFLFAVFFISYNSKTELPMLYPVILWGLYFCYDLYLRIKDTNYDSTTAFVAINYGVITSLALMIYDFNKTAAGCTQLILAVAYILAACYFIIKSSGKVKIYLRIVLFCIFLAIFFMSEGCLRIGLWSLTAIILGYCAKTYEREYLIKWAAAYYCSSVVGIFILNKDMYYLFDTSEIKPFFNMRMLSFLAPVLSGFILKETAKRTKFGISENIASLFNFCTTSLIYILVMLEIGTLIQSVTGGSSSAEFITYMTYAIIGCIYSLNLYKMSKSPNSFFDILSKLSGIAVLLLLIYKGLEFLPISGFIPLFNLRAIAFITAIGTAAYYAKNTKSDVYKYIATALGFLLLTVETNDFITKYLGENMNYLVSVSWIVYAGIITATGIFKEKKYLKISGIWITMLAVLKIIFVDMANVDFVYKMIVFILLGSVLMTISYYYNKLQK